jgi:hypothetical protein
MLIAGERADVVSKKIRWIIAGIIALLLIVVLHVGGVFIDFFAAFCYGGVRLGLHIFRSGTRGIARIHAEEQDKLARQRQSQYPQPQPQQYPSQQYPSQQ